jgi:hypothetical protein
VTEKGSIQEGPATGSSAEIHVKEVVELLQHKIRTTPAEWGKSGSDVSELEPWYIVQDGNRFTVTVPSDIEGFADDPACLVGIAALSMLQAKVVVGLPMHGMPNSWVRCNKDVDQYYYGIAAALKEQRLIDFPNYSGWFGKGYNLIGHRRLIKEGLKPWFLRGSEAQLRKVWSHKAWGDKLPVGYKHLEVLIRLAAERLILTEKAAASWVVPLQTLRGSKIKKSLIKDKLGFLLQPDVDALNVRFARGIERFEAFNTQYSTFSLDDLTNLDNKILEANKAIHDLERVSQSIIDHRAQVLFPPLQGKRKKVAKVSLKERISKLDMIDFVNRFSPCEACGIPKFTTSYDSITPAGQEEYSLDMLENQYVTYARSHATWHDILLSWWNLEFLPRYG